MLPTASFTPESDIFLSHRTPSTLVLLSTGGEVGALLSAAVGVACGRARHVMLLCCCSSTPLATLATLGPKLPTM